MSYTVTDTRASTADLPDPVAEVVRRLRETARAGERACHDDPPPNWYDLMYEAAEMMDSLGKLRFPCLNYGDQELRLWPTYSKAVDSE